MVKIAILGAHTPATGELLRILVNHSEVEIESLFSPNLIGRNITSEHHGLIGDLSLNFTDKFDLDELDLIILTDASPVINNIISSLPEYENLKLISLSKDWINQLEDNEIEVGLSEINRKALVRGARVAYIPSGILVPVLIGLVPLARFLLLNDDIDINISVPEEILPSLNIERDKEELAVQLKKTQISFNGDLNLSVNAHKDSRRGQTTVIKLKNTLSLEELEKIYENIYDDHNFTFISTNDIDSREVEGTHKVVLHLEKPDSETLIIKLVNDTYLRGGAGDAVHVLNLFFGLHEKTGLTLKASRF